MEYMSIGVLCPPLYTYPIYNKESHRHTYSKTHLKEFHVHKRNVKQYQARQHTNDIHYTTCKYLQKCS